MGGHKTADVDVVETVAATVPVLTAVDAEAVVTDVARVVVGTQLGIALQLPVLRHVNVGGTGVYPAAQVRSSTVP